MIIKTTNKNWYGIILIAIFIELSALLGYTSHSQAAITLVVALPIYHMIFGLGAIIRRVELTNSEVRVDNFKTSRVVKVLDLKEVRITRDHVLFRTNSDNVSVPRSCMSKRELIKLVTPFKDILVEKDESKFL